jgi:hypothetical protein
MSNMRLISCSHPPGSETIIAYENPPKHEGSVTVDQDENYEFLPNRMGIRNKS